MYIRTHIDTNTIYIYIHTYIHKSEKERERDTVAFWLTPCAIIVTVKFERFDFEGDLVTARTSTPRCFRGRSHSTSCATSLNLCLRRSLAISTLGGGDHHLPERDCGRKDKTVKITYIYIWLKSANFAGWGTACAFKVSESNMNVRIPTVGCME